MRINFSHATYDEATLRMNNLRSAHGVHSHGGKDFNLRAVLLDTQGPEIRTGKMVGDEKILLEQGNECVVTTNKDFANQGTAEKFYVNYEKLSEIRTGKMVG